LHGLKLVGQWGDVGVTWETWHLSFFCCSIWWAWNLHDIILIQHTIHDSRNRLVRVVARTTVNKPWTWISRDWEPRILMTPETWYQPMSKSDARENFLVLFVLNMLLIIETIMSRFRQSYVVTSMEWTIIIILITSTTTREADKRWEINDTTVRKSLAVVESMEAGRTSSRASECCRVCLYCPLQLSSCTCV